MLTFHIVFHHHVPDNQKQEKDEVSLSSAEAPNKEKDERESGRGFPLPISAQSINNQKNIKEASAEEREAGSGHLDLLGDWFVFIFVHSFFYFCFRLFCVELLG